MNPETIVTAELLAGLMQCPFCGSGVAHKVPGKTWTQFKCRTLAHEECPAGVDRSELCKWEEPKLLRARVASLEAKVQRLESGGDKAILNSYLPDRLAVWNEAKEEV